MKRLAFFLILMLALGMGITLPSLSQTAPGLAQDRPAAQAAPDRARVAGALQGAPVMFIENAGQFADGARFQVRGGNGTIWLADDTIWVTVLEQTNLSPQPIPEVERGAPPSLAGKGAGGLGRHGVNLKLSFPGANPHTHLEPFNRLDTHVSYFLGNDAAKWQPDVPVWGGVRYVDLYPGIDLEFTSENGRLVQRLVVQPGADLNAVGLRVEGADAIELLSSPDDGRWAGGEGLRLTTAVGDFALPLLTVEGWNMERANVERTNAQTFEVTSRFSSAPSLPSLSAQTAGASDLLYSTFLGGGDVDDGFAIAVDGNGAAYVTGQTCSSSFPTTSGAFDTSYNGCSDAFVVKLNSAGSALAYATFLGGSSDDERGNGIAVDGSGAAYVTGDTLSTDFPTTPGAFDRTFGGGTGGPCGGSPCPDVFVAKLNPSGSALVYSTFIGGSSDDGGDGIAVDGSGAAFVTGGTLSADFPTTLGAFDTTYNGSSDAFVVKLNSAGSALAYATFLGGSGGDGGSGIAIDETGNAHATGVTYSSGFPTTIGAFDASYNGQGDAFVVKLSPSGTALAYATFLGGSHYESGYGIAVDGSGAAYVAGDTRSADFPTTPGAFDTACGGCVSPGYHDDAFVVKLNSAGSALAYATFLGGGHDDYAQAIAVDGFGVAYVVGDSMSSDFPITPGAFDTSFNGDYDSFLVKLNAMGSALAYATFLGGSSRDLGSGIAVDGTGNAYATGWTYYSDFPTTIGAFDTGYNGASDAFVAKLVMVGVTCPLNQWRGEYYNNRDLQGTPTLVRCDLNIDFYWGGSSPKPGVVNADNFSVRWTQDVNFSQTGWYRFRTFTDDGLRLYVDGELLINDWTPRTFAEKSAGKQLAQGTHQVKMEYVEWSYDAMAHLAWYLCPNGAGDCSMNIMPQYQTWYPDVPMPTICPNWQNLPGETKEQSFYNYGCWVTSFAMALQKLGVDTSPTQLNEWLSGEWKAGKLRGYQGRCNGNLDPTWIPAFAFNWGRQHGRSIILKLAYPSSWNEIADLIRQGTPVLMHNNQLGHFFLAVDVAKSGGVQTFGLNDPWHSWGCRQIPIPRQENCASGPTQPTKHVVTLSTAPYFEVYDNPHYLKVVPSFASSLGFAIDNAEILVTDSQGRRTGFNPATRQIVLEIPESMYFDSKVIPPGGTDDGRIRRVLVLPDNAGGNYRLEVFGRSTATSPTATSAASNVEIQLTGFDSQFNPTDATINTIVQPGSVATFNVTFNPGQQIVVIRRLFLPMIVKRY